MQNNLQDVLGLTLNEARVYEALIKGFPPEISILKTETGLPRTRIYEVLSSLSAKQLVEKKKSSNGYRLIPPQESIRDLVIQLDQDHERQKATIQEFGSYLSKIWNGTITQDQAPGVEVLSIEDVEPLFIAHLQSIKNRAWIAAGASKASIDMRASGRSLASVYHSDLDVRYLISAKNLGERIRNGFKHFAPFHEMEIKIRTNRELYTSYVLLDDVIYIFFFGGKDVIKPSALRTSSIQLIKSFEWMFTKLWNNGESI